MDKIKDIVIQIENLKKEQKFEECKKILHKALTKYNWDYRLYEELTDVYLYMWELDKWLKSVNFALRINKDSITWNYLKGFLLLSKEKIEEAIKYLSHSNKLMWNNSEVLRNLWWAYTMVWKTDKWISILQRALNLNPDDNLITEDLAMALIWSWKINEWNVLLQKIWKKIVS